MFDVSIFGVKPDARWVKRCGGPVTFIAAGDPLPDRVSRADYCAAAFNLGCTALIPPSAKPSEDAKLHGFAGWAMRDEPDGRMSADEYLATVHKLRSRGHRLYGNFAAHQITDGSVPVPYYAKCIEHLWDYSWDHYLANRNIPLGVGLSKWERITYGLWMAAGREKRYRICIETGQHLKTSRPVSVDEFAAQVYHAVRLGAAGVVLFSLNPADRNCLPGFSWDTTTPELAEAMPSIFARARAPRPMAVVTSDKMVWSVA